MEGQEVSILALCDGKTCVPLMPSQDHKAVGEGDRGPHWGHGAYSPVPAVDEALQRGFAHPSCLPTLQSSASEDHLHRGAVCRVDAD